jgi:hypothetical protein
MALELQFTDYLLPPVGTTAQRPTASTGMLRYNSTTNTLEFYNGSDWISL